MEKNEKNQEVPAWVKIVQDFPPVVQQSVGNLCSTIIQQLATVACLSADLFEAVCHEVKDSVAGAVATATNHD